MAVTRVVRNVRSCQVLRGPPEKNIDYKISGMVRAAEIFGPKLPISIELKASYDAKDNVVGFELPIYAFIDNENKLRGGVRVGWDSGEKRFALGLCGHSLQPACLLNAKALRLPEPAPARSANQSDAAKNGLRADRVIHEVNAARWNIRIEPGR